MPPLPKLPNLFRRKSSAALSDDPETTPNPRTVPPLPSQSSAVSASTSSPRNAHTTSSSTNSPAAPTPPPTRAPKSPPPINARPAEPSHTHANDDQWKEGNLALVTADGTRLIVHDYALFRAR